MTENAKTVIQLLTAAAALVGALTGIWNSYQFGRLDGRVGAIERSHNSHVNAAELHR